MFHKNIFKFWITLETHAICSMHASCKKYVACVTHSTSFECYIFFSSKFCIFMILCTFNILGMWHFLTSKVYTINTFWTSSSFSCSKFLIFIILWLSRFSVPKVCTLKIIWMVKKIWFQSFTYSTSFECRFFLQINSTWSSGECYIFWVSKITHI